MDWRTKSSLSSFRMATFGHYPQTKDGTDTSPIEWLVLDVDKAGCKALLLSRYGLYGGSYHPEYAHVTWEICELRAWLNGDFLNDAFTAQEQSFILQTLVDNSKSQGRSEWPTDAGNDTLDRIFVLSWAETMKYLPEEEMRRCAPTPYAKAHSAWSDERYMIDGMAGGWWWMRSPGDSQSSATSVHNAGNMVDDCIWAPNACIRPALWVSLDAGVLG